MFSWFIKALEWLGLSSLVKSSSGWEKARPAIKKEGQWAFAKKALCKVNGQWQLTFNSRLVVDIDTNQNNYNLFNELGNVVPEVHEIVVNIKSGVVIGSVSSANPAFELGDAFNGVSVVINNYGTIAGRGGNGGGAGSGGGRGGHGAAGGTALDVKIAAHPVTVSNHGVIAGGGGGGGGGGAVDWRIVFALGNPQNPQIITNYAVSNGGSGGRGETVSGSAKTNGSGSPQGWQPSTSHPTRAIGGNGGTGGAAGRSGGNGRSPSKVGGNIGQLIRVSSNKVGSGGSGGRAGYAIDGNSKTVLLVIGSVLGGRVN